MRCKRTVLCMAVSLLVMLALKVQLPCFYISTPVTGTSEVTVSAGGKREETKKPVDETDKSLFCSLTKSPCHSKVEWSSP